MGGGRGRWGQRAGGEGREREHAEEGVREGTEGGMEGGREGGGREGGSRDWGRKGTGHRRAAAQQMRKVGHSKKCSGTRGSGF